MTGDPAGGEGVGRVQERRAARDELDARADAAGEFGFGSGPANRYVSEPRAPGDIRASSSLPGGLPGSPFYVNLLPPG